MNFLNLTRILVTVFVVIGITQRADAILVQSTFDTDLDGWTSNVPAEVSWQEMGGNPGGFVRHDDGSSNPSDIIAPAKFLGDWSNANGTGFISFDHQIINGGTLTGVVLPYQIEIFGGVNSAIWNEDPLVNPMSWENHTANLIESEWDVTGSWDDLLASVEQLRIKIEYVQGPGDSSGIDNVFIENGRMTSNVIPEPSSLLLFAGGVIGFLVKKKKP